MTKGLAMLKSGLNSSTNSGNILTNATAPTNTLLDLAKVGSCNDGSQPPVFAICFPNPKASEEAYVVLHKQHELLQQTFSRSGVNQVSIEKMQLAGTILQDWKKNEAEVQKLWST
jgi:hypothetical protein